jgi:ribosomal protein S18 acetylase RimI-like enzyme
MRIRPYVSADEGAVVALWERCGLTRPWNDPRKDIARKLQVGAELFLVGVIDGAIVATAMGGYDGHRGWVNYLAVDIGQRRRGIGSALMRDAERRLRLLGCPKINLQVRSENKGVQAFYAALGFEQDEAVSMGKRLESDER